MNLPDFHQKPHFLRATFHINTPMFVAGSNQKEAELTPTAFKGVMRFWWRALNWSKIYLKHNDKSSALKELHKQEAQLFGLASGENKGGQGKCLVNTLTLSNPRNWQLPANRNGIVYLLGQGLYRHGAGLTRPALLNNQSFTIDLTVAQNSVKSIQDTLQIFGLLGGLGSRSRHGFGSVTLTKLEEKSLTDADYRVIDFEKDAKKALTELLTKYQCRENNELPPLSAFYRETRIDIVKLTDKNPNEALDRIGKNQQSYRSYGSKNRQGEYKVNGEDPERNFTDDHDLILRFINDRNKPNKHPRRVVFGLPHNYRYSSGANHRVDAKIGRRASPLIQHIHLYNNQYFLIHTFLKSEFLPHNEKIKVGNTDVNCNVDYQVIENFMDRSLFNNKESI